ncbi:carbohydrate esterase family 5 protein [Pseudocercospora fijiensis CIRAD86]|uniref:Carbohydrate esterase family 5 protein n=1 Tax=Pseudocercospora fijiensis (strain CIRAD86) TaxID=383855 RepID=M3AUZ6_PSEFD|nr:carbohydrate esterase family 5 protein [Pseudocercospora fijiensis CIRAD86]EME81302.1 carbohydrate esterase family 5 protein [Pseudocercospora fijiensis CIRAD86]
MYTRTTISSLLLAAPAILAQSTGSGSCTDVHIFIARGWNEPYPGRQGTLVDDICADLSGLTCDYEDVVYDAASTDYCPSVLTGETNGLQQIQSYYAKCPDTKLVVSGYSEGANIIGDILSGGTCGDFTGLGQTSGASCNIAAGLLFGDPQHLPNQPYNVLNGSAGVGTGGSRTEAQAQILDSYTPRLRSYCQIDDLVCAPGLGADTVEAHTNYFKYYSEDAASWVAGLVNSFQKGQYCSSTTTSSTVSSVATSTASASSLSDSVITSIPAVSNIVASSSIASTTTCTEEAVSTPAVSSPAPSTITFWSTKEITITSCAETVTDCPARSTVIDTTSIAVSTTILIPTASGSWATAISTPASSTPASSTTVVNGKPAVVAYSTTTSTTTLWNFPTISIAKTYPVATSYVASVGWSNGTVATGVPSGVAAPSGAGSGSWSSAAPSGTGSGSWSSATASGNTPAAYTGAASNVKAAGWVAGAVGLVGMAML